MTMSKFNIAHILHNVYLSRLRASFSGCWLSPLK